MGWLDTLNGFESPFPQIIVENECKKCAQLKFQWLGVSNV